MTRPPWKDAVVRAQRSPPRMEGANPSTATNTAPRQQPGQVTAVAPGLQPLLDERRALEERIQRLVGTTPSDPRYNVEPLDQRRAALTAWGEERDASREQRRRQGAAPAPDPLPFRGTAADFLRPTNADQLRATPAELPAELRHGRAGDRFDRTSGPDSADGGLPLRGLMRALDMPRDEPNAPQSRRRRGADAAEIGAVARSLDILGRRRGAADTEGTEAPRTASSGPQTRERDANDALERRLARARAMAARARRALDGADRALDHARDAIPSDWQRRVEERIPGLGRADGYVRDTVRKLSVLVGSIDEIGQKADRLRGMAREMRELREADEANDEARRERALDRLRARRQED
jgi:hypothetical protein